MGAVAYLTTSKYGQGLTEIRINNSSKFITGCAATTPATTKTYGEYLAQTDGSEGYYEGCENQYNTEIGYLASTTGNITGIYDMSGGTWEYVMGIVEDAMGSGVPYSGRSNIFNSGFTGELGCPTCDTGYGNDTSITSIVAQTYPHSKYFDLYSYGESAYHVADYNRGKLGDATIELTNFTSNVSLGDNTRRYHSTWNKDYAYFIYKNGPWLKRGGYYIDGVGTGMFSFDYHYGGAYSYISFRTVLAK